MPASFTILRETNRLICPRCESQLAPEAQLSCSSCGLLFPQLEGIPILVAKPQEYLGVWAQQFRNFIVRQQQAIQHEQKMITSPGCYPPMRERLKNAVTARAANLQTIADIMTPLRDVSQGIAPSPAVSSTGQFSNLMYLLRDWAWETGEPQMMCDKVKEMLPANLAVESLLVLGAGGCGESYLLHEHYQSPLTVSVEIDPFKLLAASRILSGKSISLYQILQNNVRDARGHVSHWELRAPRVPQGDFLFLLADARNLPLRPRSFHVVFTPFLIDAIGEDLRTLASRIYHVVQTNGLWVNFGVMTFPPEIAYTGEEVLSIVEDAGFTILNHGYTTKPHVAPRESCLQQVFDCLHFTAIKSE
jgi:hypothetical protein